MKSSTILKNEFCNCQFSSRSKKITILVDLSRLQFKDKRSCLEKKFLNCPDFEKFTENSMAGPYKLRSKTTEIAKKIKERKKARKAVKAKRPTNAPEILPRSTRLREKLRETVNNRLKAFPEKKKRVNYRKFFIIAIIIGFIGVYTAGKKKKNSITPTKKNPYGVLITCDGPCPLFRDDLIKWFSSNPKYVHIEDNPDLHIILGSVEKFSGRAWYAEIKSLTGRLDHQKKFITFRLVMEPDAEGKTQQKLYSALMKTITP